MTVHEIIVPESEMDPSSSSVSSLAFDLENYRIKGAGVGDSMYYVHDFITEDEEDYLVRKILDSPLPKWKTVPTGRRLQYWGGLMTKSNMLIPEDLPAWVTKFPNLLKRISQTKAFSAFKHSHPNQLLINEYLPGQGIDAHTDGPAYYSTVCTISLLWPVVVLLHPPPTPDVPLSTSNPGVATLTSPDRKPLRVLLEPKSLFVIKDEVYNEWKHEILPATEDDFVGLINQNLLGDEKTKILVKESAKGIKRQKRISLTFRGVEKVGKGLRLG